MFLSQVVIIFVFALVCFVYLRKPQNIAAQPFDSLISRVAIYFNSHSLIFYHVLHYIA
jgi:hypothetical protein